MMPVATRLDSMHIPILRLNDLEIYCRKTINTVCGLFVQRHGLRIHHEAVNDECIDYPPDVCESLSVKFNYPIYRVALVTSAGEKIGTRDFLLYLMIGGTPQQTRQILTTGASVLMREVARKLKALA